MFCFVVFMFLSIIISLRFIKIKLFCYFLSTLYIIQFIFLKMNFSCSYGIFFIWLYLIIIEIIMGSIFIFGFR